MDMDSRDFASVVCSDQAAHRFVSDYDFGKIRFWSLEGRHQDKVIVFCRTSAAILAVRSESESYSGW